VATAPQATTSAEAVARGYFEAIGAGDADAATAHWHPEGIDDVTPLRVVRGADEIRDFLASMAAAMPDLEFTVQRVTADERVAAVEWRLRGTFSGASFEGIDPTGRHVELRGVDCVEVEDGKIVKNTAYYDGAAFARAVGLLPAQDSGAERAMLSAFNGATKLRTIVREQLDR